MLGERLGLIDAVDTDDEAEVARGAGLDAGQRVLVDGAGGWLEAERLGAGEEGVRRGLAGEVVAAGDDAVDDRRRTCR